MAQETAVITPRQTAKAASPMEVVGNFVGSLALHALLLFFAATVVFPMLWVIYTSLKTNQEFFKDAWALPAVPQWVNYARAWNEAHVGQYAMNSVIVTAVSLVLILAFSSMTAYALARFEFPGKSLILYAYIGGMMFPVVMVIIPLFMLLRDVGIWGDWRGLFPAYLAYSLPFTVFVLTPFFRTLPHELEEAAIIDGASHFAVFWRVMLPLARPGLVTAGVFNFMGIWNEYVLALVILAKPETFTLPLGLAKLQIQTNYKSDWTAMLAGVVIIMVPTILVYAVAQKRLAEGITLGALKG